MSRQIGRRFCDIRRIVLNLTQAELAAALGCSRVHVSRVETGKNEYTFSQLQGLSALCGVPVASFFDGYVYTDPAAMVAEWLPGYLKLPPDVRSRFDDVAERMLAMVDAADGRPPMDVFKRD